MPPTTPDDLGAWWGDAHDREALRVVAEGVRELAGFEVAAVSVVHEGLLLTVAVAGDDEAAAHLARVHTPIEELLAEMALAEDWGPLRFLPHDRATDRLDRWSWVPDIEPVPNRRAWHPEDLLCALLRDDKGEVRGVLGMDLPRNRLRPDAEQRKVLEALARQAEQTVVSAIERRDATLSLEQELAASAYRRQLIDVLSHELQNPVAAISGNLELLAEEELSPVALRSVGAIERAARRIRVMVSDLLALAEVDDPARVREPEPVDVAEVARDVAELMATEARHREVHLELDLAPGPQVVPGVPSEIDTLVANLVANAVKYSERGGTVQVQVRPAIGGTGAVVVQVRDQGIGISPADQERLFEEFFRADNTATRSRPGTGLGLAIVNRVVRAHRGHVDVESQPGRGTTFRVVLPGPPA
ncbi:HAMP domain-containing sensor histidine kinase [Nocardioides nanhaiensis]|uniref:histidine kinase n=1 Tax=Nocardioides nanhaiensis TaxID=1476871 RepID=A0ABP8W3X1_9ACTN